MTFVMFWVTFVMVFAMTRVSIGRALALGLALAASGCGGSPAPPSGAHVFATSCRACHTLVGNDRTVTQGGDLAGYRMTAAELTSFAAIMPVKRRLSAAELQAVVRYVLDAQRRYARGAG